MSSEQANDSPTVDEMKKCLISGWKRRQIYVTAHNLEAFRLATHEELRVPVGIDVYGARFEGVGARSRLVGGKAVLQIYEEDVASETLDALREILADEFALEGFYEKKRFRVKEEVDAGGDLKADPVELVVDEYGHKFLVNLNNYLDTGLFLDHRETRKRVEFLVGGLVQMGGEEADVQVLNLFAYTGAFSVYAAGGGARMTHSVDLSKTYCDWARRNLDLNECDPEKHWVYRMDVFEFYKYAARKELTFDLIIIDPPTFSRGGKNAGGGDFSVQRDHVKLIEGASELLKDGAQMLFSNNCLDFEMDTALENNFDIQNIQSETIPPDFWEDTIQKDWWEKHNQIHNCYLIRRRNREDTDSTKN